MSSDESRNVGIAADGSQAEWRNEASIVSVSNNYLKFASHSAMAASHTQVHGANGKLSIWSSQVFGILVSCGCCGWWQILPNPGLDQLSSTLATPRVLALTWEIPLPG